MVLKSYFRCECGSFKWFIRFTFFEVALKLLSRMHGVLHVVDVFIADNNDDDDNHRNNNNLENLIKTLISDNYHI